MIVRWPGVTKAGTVTGQVGHVVDFLPTLVELSGANSRPERKGTSVPRTEGHSLVPVLCGQEREGHESLCWFLFGNRAIREGRWKLVWGAHAESWELYDMESDRTETRDLAPQFPNRVNRMA